jgi:hypothetical protein
MCSFPSFQVAARAGISLVILSRISLVTPIMRELHLILQTRVFVFSIVFPSFQY